MGNQDHLNRAFMIDSDFQNDLIIAQRRSPTALNNPLDETQ